MTKIGLWDFTKLGASLRLNMGRKWRWEGNETHWTAKSFNCRWCCIGWCFEKEACQLLVAAPDSQRPNKTCFRLFQTVQINIRIKHPRWTAQHRSWGLEVGYMHIPNYPSCFGWGGFFVWWGLIGAALLHIEIIGRRRCQGVTFKETPWTPLLDGSDGSAWRASLARGCPEAQCPRCPLSTTYQVVLQSSGV